MSKSLLETCTCDDAGCHARARYGIYSIVHILTSNTYTVMVNTEIFYCWAFDMLALKFPLASNVTCRCDKKVSFPAQYPRYLFH